MSQRSPVYEAELLLMWLRCRMSQHSAYIISIIIIIIIMHFVGLGPLQAIERYLRER